MGDTLETCEARLSSSQPDAEPPTPPASLSTSTDGALLTKGEIQAAQDLVFKLGTCIETVERRRALEDEVKRLTAAVQELRESLRNEERGHRSEISDLENDVARLESEVEWWQERGDDTGALIAWGLAAGAHMSDAMPHVSLETYDMIREAALERPTVREPTQQEMFLARREVKVREQERAADAVEVARTVARFSKLEID